MKESVNISNIWMNKIINVPCEEVQQKKGTWLYIVCVMGEGYSDGSNFWDFNRFC